jgi:glycosyltransferase involved in cell wall biosynthesis
MLGFKFMNGGSEMNLQVLIATMNQTDYSILKKMNIRSDAIIVNQCDKNHLDEFMYDGNSIFFYSFNERGVGLSRNTSLMRATADICLFADDDVTYYDNYKKIILEEFTKNPNADVIVFNLKSTHPQRGKRINKENKRIRLQNVFRYGTYRIAVRLSSVRRKNINFSLLFGGGTKYSAGEDSLFLRDCLKNGLKIFSSKEFIGSVSHEESTWFKGYNDKYFFDKGAFFEAALPRFKYFLLLYYSIKLRKHSFFRVIKLMYEGTKGYKNDLSFNNWKQITEGENND